MNKQLIKYYLVVSLSFFADILVLMLCQTQMLFSVRAFYYAQAATQVSFIYLLLPGALVILESFLYSGYCAVDLIAMVPLTFALYKIQKMVTGSLWITSCLAFGCFIFHALVVDYGLFDRSLSCVVNLKGSLFHAILIVVVIRYILRGSQGNRL